MVELPALRKDGTSIWVELRLAPITSTECGTFALAILRDITIRKEAEAAREEAMDQLSALQRNCSSATKT